MTKRTLIILCVTGSLANQSVTSAATVPERSELDQQWPATLFCPLFFLLPASSASNSWANRESQICSPGQSHRIPCLWLATSNFPSPMPISSNQRTWSGYHRWWWHASISEMSCPLLCFHQSLNFCFKCDSCDSNVTHTSQEQGTCPTWFWILNTCLQVLLHIIY